MEFGIVVGMEVSDRAPKQFAGVICNITDRGGPQRVFCEAFGATDDDMQASSCMGGLTGLGGMQRVELLPSEMQEAAVYEVIVIEDSSALPPVMLGGGFCAPEAVLAARWQRGGPQREFCEAFVMKALDEYGQAKAATQFGMLPDGCAVVEVEDGIGRQFGPAACVLLAGNVAMPCGSLGGPVACAHGGAAC